MNTIQWIARQFRRIADNDRSQARLHLKTQARFEYYRLIESAIDLTPGSKTSLQGRTRYTIADAASQFSIPEKQIEAQLQALGIVQTTSANLSADEIAFVLFAIRAATQDSGLNQEPLLLRFIAERFISEGGPRKIDVNVVRNLRHRLRAGVTDYAAEQLRSMARVGLHPHYITQTKVLSRIEALQHHVALLDVSIAEHRRAITHGPTIDATTEGRIQQLEDTSQTIGALTSDVRALSLSVETMLAELSTVATIAKRPVIADERLAIIDSLLTVLSNRVNALEERNDRDRTESVATMERNHRRIMAAADRPRSTWTFDRFDEDRLRNRLIDNGFLADSTICRLLIDGVRQSRFIVLTGPSGVGKSHLARALARVFVGKDDGAVTFCEPKASWQSIDSIGAAWPVGDRLLPVIGPITESILACIERNGRAWIVIDEINRADPDAIFGGLLTALSEPMSDAWFQVPGTARRICIPPSFRIIATMNDADSNHAFGMSSSLDNRCMYIPIRAPSVSDEVSLIIDRVTRPPFDRTSSTSAANRAGSPSRQTADITDFISLCSAVRIRQSSAVSSAYLSVRDTIAVVEAAVARSGGFDRVTKGIIDQAFADIVVARLLRVSAPIRRRVVESIRGSWLIQSLARLDSTDEQ